MTIQTKYNYESAWRDTNEEDLLKIIEEEIGNADPKGTLDYIKESVTKGKTITVGTCKFRVKQ